MAREHRFQLHRLHEPLTPPAGEDWRIHSFRSILHDESDEILIVVLWIRDGWHADADTAPRETPNRGGDSYAGKGVEGALRRFFLTGRQRPTTVRLRFTSRATQSMPVAGIPLASLASSIAALAPDTVECLDAKGGILRAVRFSEVLAAFPYKRKTGPGALGGEVKGARDHSGVNGSGATKAPALPPARRQQSKRRR